MIYYGMNLARSKNIYLFVFHKWLCNINLVEHNSLPNVIVSLTRLFVYRDNTSSSASQHNEMPLHCFLLTSHWMYDVHVSLYFRAHTLQNQGASSTFLSASTNPLHCHQVFKTKRCFYCCTCPSPTLIFMLWRLCEIILNRSFPKQT